MFKEIFGLRNVFADFHDFKWGIKSIEQIQNVFEYYHIQIFLTEVFLVFCDFLDSLYLYTML